MTWNEELTTEHGAGGKGDDNGDIYRFVASTGSDRWTITVGSWPKPVVIGMMSPITAGSWLEPVVITVLHKKIITFSYEIR
jgi:hypothetical protein